MTTLIKMGTCCAVMGLCWAMGVQAAEENPVLRELPASKVGPDSWLKELLGRQLQGLTGHPAVMGFPFNKGMWADSMDKNEREYPQWGSDWWPYEQTAYYLDGALRCAYMTGDKNLLALCRKNIDSVLANPKKDGRLGSLNVDNDEWPMVMFMRMLIEEYENSGDSKLLAAIENHYEVMYPDKTKLPDLKLSGFEQRRVIHVENLCRLAQLTGKKEYVELSEKLYEKFCADNPNDSKAMANMLKDIVSHEHACSYHYFLELPIVLYIATGKPMYHEAARKAFKMLENNHELVDGLSSGHEELSGKRDDKVHETCNAIDFVWTCGFMLVATGEAMYADKIEKVFFNAGLGALGKDFKTHQYYSGPNQVILTDSSSHWNFDSDWGLKSSGPRMCYRPGHDTECCSGNIHRLVPAYMKRMWLVDDKAASVTVPLYGPSYAQINLAGQASPLTIKENTRYPFEDKISFEFKTQTPQKLKFRMRIPRWSSSFSVSCNGTTQALEKGADGFVLIEREFRDGDRVDLVLDNAPVVKRTIKGISLSYGPLVFSLPVKANVKKITDKAKTSHEFPAFEMTPASDWNYALPAKLTASDIKVIRRANDAYPWEESNTPIRIMVDAKTATNWTILDKPFTPQIPEQIQVSADIKTIELVPLGCTYLRVTEFPVYE